MKDWTIEENFLLKRECEDIAGRSGWLISSGKKL
jgi:hypothetical protein